MSQPVERTATLRTTRNANADSQPGTSGMRRRAPSNGHIGQVPSDTGHGIARTVQRESGRSLTRLLTPIFHGASSCATPRDVEDRCGDWRRA